MIVILFLLFATSYGNIANQVIDIYAQVGTNVTLQLPNSTQHLPTLNSALSINHMSWYKEEDFYSIFNQTLPYFFQGQLLCNFFNTEKTKWEHYPLEFDCTNRTLTLFDVRPSYSGIYNAKVYTNFVERNTYFNLFVVDLPRPQCEISSYYVSEPPTEDSCIITIDCSSSKYPVFVHYNGKRSKRHYFLNERGGGGNLPNLYTTTFDFHNLNHSYSFVYPFNDLCNDIIALETGSDFTPLIIVTIVVSLLVIILGIAYLIYHCRTLKTKPSDAPEIRLL
ncbi:CR1-beta [Human mastadenovirus G]|nr:CR1-beta [Human mastadenovirus G]